ncbi:MAG TPA: cupin domain-containing protein [Edaphobacter sp.]|uniref:cupin domain-containing protein n=1 Tax=Edaphobacter sp. TaxID=1934404 RepID=UPI002C678C00|nr:cupin domain-containing protein [Edaphobacter sp.]HUZ95391.1 cupin domain-containing protein [Edaphobacter sp.]
MAGTIRNTPTTDLSGSAYGPSTGEFRRGAACNRLDDVNHAKETSMDYTFLVNLQQEFALPEKGILSRVLRKDDQVNVTLFGFSQGEALSTHSSPTPAILYFLEGEAEVQLGEDKVDAQQGSFIYMPPMLPHGISAKTALRVLLIQMKDNSQ